MSSDRNDGISIACGIRNTVVRYRYLIELVDVRRSPLLPASEIGRSRGYDVLLDWRARPR